MINGRVCSGKDEVGLYLQRKYGFNKLFFAQGIYEIAYKYFGMKEKNRVWLQDIGQKMREVKPTIWIDYTLNQVNEWNNWVVTDIRQANEYLECLKYGFLPIRVSANLDLRIDRAIKRDGEYPDISRWELPGEIGADPFEYIEIDNNGTLENLNKQIEDIIHKDHTEFMNYLYDRYKNKFNNIRE